MVTTDSNSFKLFLQQDTRIPDCCFCKKIFCSEIVHNCLSRFYFKKQVRISRRWTNLHSFIRLLRICSVVSMTSVFYVSPRGLLIPSRLQVIPLSYYMFQVQGYYGSLVWCYAWFTVPRYKTIKTTDWCLFYASKIHPGKTHFEWEAFLIRSVIQLKVNPPLYSCHR